MSDNSDGNVELVERFIAALDVSDTETMDGMIHDDFYFEMPFAPDLLPRLHVGREKSIAFFKSMDAWWDRANFKDLKVDVIGGDEGRLVATYRSETVYASTGTQYRNSYISLFSVTDGKLSYMKEHFDPIAPIVALGGSVNPPSMPG
ncbi:ketosteroid isomerase-like protein [Catenuloplanes nepalensis]|uniref:Ketosteroid isomerase-like protein n=1 Tax=Catenuloplanes nepalensis TaxID=587533 RepID=A0ABT9MRN4_9ACTN|nr:nuclear transport factor 2 family protein [Catenuloplanes nepalensis]MDP9794087.1 ketosteroid isomerase-like protein [Catenuloplanes nepalensis]